MIRINTKIRSFCNIETINNEYKRRRDIFLLNMLLQLSISMFLNYATSLSAFGSPFWVQKIIKKMYDFDSEKSLTALIIILIINSTLVIIRIIWYFIVGNGTWVSTFINFLFLLPHISIFIIMNSIATVLPAKEKARATLLETFVRTFIGNHIYKNAQYYEGSTCPYSTDEELVEAVAVLYVDLFDALLDKTGTYHVITYTCIFFVLFLI